MTHSGDIRIWHSPPGSRGQLGITVPVGPKHDPIDSLLISDRAAVASNIPAVHIVVVNGVGAVQRIPNLAERLAEISQRVVLASIDRDVGYIHAVRSALHIADDLQLDKGRIGFLDADATLRAPQHWGIAQRTLDAEPALDAVSGLVVHDECQVWETLSSAAFIAAMETATGHVVTKPYIQGGAGGTLSRRARFAMAVDNALSWTTLIGPTLSATAVACGRRVEAHGLMPCGHTPRRTMAEWTLSVTAYERSWRTLVAAFGHHIETPWQAFLDQAEASLAGNRRLLSDVRHNTALRQQIVSQVEAEQASIVGDAA